LGFGFWGGWVVGETNHPTTQNPKPNHKLIEVSEMI
jgi:hypothetical protein